MDFKVPSVTANQVSKTDYRQCVDGMIILMNVENKPSK